MDYHDSVEWLKEEVARLKQLLEWEQAVHREFRADIFRDAVMREAYRNKVLAEVAR
jgi:hypothetical protein